MEKWHPNMNMFVASLMMFIFVGTAQNTRLLKSVKVGVVLNLNTWVGKSGLSCIKMALSDLYGTGLDLHVRDSGDDVVAAAAAALDLIKNVQVHAIMGPQTSMQANFVSELGKKAKVPIITFSATNPCLTSLTNPYLIRATHPSSSQVQAIASIIQSFGWREAVPIYADNDYGHGFLPFLVDALQHVDARVPYRSTLPLSASDDLISKELYKLKGMQTRVFVVHLLPPLSCRLFSRAHDIGMMSDGYVWIMTDGLTNLFPSLPPSVIDSMQGAIGVAPYVPPTPDLTNFTARWKIKFKEDYPNITNSGLCVYGLLAYDAARALAMALESANTANLGFHKLTNGSTNSTDLENFGVSQIGPQLQKMLSSTRFIGLSGDFHLVDNELHQPAFKIVNIVGNAERSIGFWTRERGLVREMNPTSVSKLRQVVWPGDSTSVPKGWEIPTNGTRLKILVPVSFKEFVNVSDSDDPTTNSKKVTGYCIDVFDAVMRALPYHIDYDYIPFQKPDGTSAGSYSDLIDQVFFKKYDAVVGDTTILANRSQFVDFTLPYTESGVSMVVPIKDKRERNAWVFMKPLTWDLWVATVCFFIFIGFVVWVLEHRINEDFRGPPSYQVGTSFWFSFSTMVFAHRERVVSNLGRFVVIIWAFVVLILTQSYTASLTTMLTVQQLLPTASDLNELVKSGDNVGYLEGSFVLDVLKKHNFDESKLKMYNSIEECHRLLSLGSKKGGIAAAVDETPYMRLFLSKHCNKYTKVQQIYKADGFGFVFPKGSPLVPEISRAILKVTEGSEMEKIEKQWLGEEGRCPDLSSSPSSYSMGLDSFWGLFLIVGVAAMFSLMVYATMFIKEHRNVDPQAPLWTRIGVLLRIFDQKDHKSHTFRKTQVHVDVDGDRDREGMCSPPCPEASPNACCPPSPSSTHTDLNVEHIADPNLNDQVSQEDMVIV